MSKGIEDMTAEGAAGAANTVARAKGCMPAEKGGNPQPAKQTVKSGQ